MSRIALIFTFLAAPLLAVPAHAEAAGSIAVVQIKKAMEGTGHWKQAVKALEKVKKERETSLQAIQEQLKKAEDGLGMQKTLLDKKAFEKKMADLEEDKMMLAQTLMVSQQQFGALEKNLASQMLQRIQQIIQVVSAKSEYMLVIEVGEGNIPNVLYAKKGIDITKKVAKEYSKRFKDPLKVPEVKDPAEMLKKQLNTN